MCERNQSLKFLHINNWLRSSPPERLVYTEKVASSNLAGVIYTLFHEFTDNIFHEFYLRHINKPISQESHSLNTILN
jgi:hypothetical protein